MGIDKQSNSLMSMSPPRKWGSRSLAGEPPALPAFTSKKVVVQNSHILMGPFLHAYIDFWMPDQVGHDDRGRLRLH